MFKSKYSQGPRSGFNPKTAAKPQMQPTAIRGQAGSEEQGASQIEASPVPFQNPQGAIRGVSTVTAAMRGQKQGTHAGGTKPRDWRAAQAVSDPMSHGAQMTATGHKPDYRGGYAPSTHPKAKARILRGTIKGAKPLVDNGDAFSLDSIKDWNRKARGL